MSLYSLIEEMFPHSNYSQEDLIKYQEDPSYLLYTYENEPLGFILASISIDEAEIILIGVKKEERKKGIGTILFNRLVEELEKRGVKSLFIEVRSKNKTAIEFYEKKGFKRLGLRKNYYGDDDALTYKKEI